jgi:hypothetical protein
MTLQADHFSSADESSRDLTEDLTARPAGLRSMLAAAILVFASRV